MSKRLNWLKHNFSFQNLYQILREIKSLNFSKKENLKRYISTFLNPVDNYKKYTSKNIYCTTKVTN